MYQLLCIDYTHLVIDLMGKMSLFCKVGLVVDHVNRIPNDNRIKNLRIATYVQNSQNKGETFYEKENLWCSKQDLNLRPSAYEADALTN